MLMQWEEAASRGQGRVEDTNSRKVIDVVVLQTLPVATALCL
jgi:hypothetical protein